MSVEVQVTLVQLLTNGAFVLLFVWPVARVDVVAQLVRDAKLLPALKTLDLRQRARVHTFHVHV
jgi:hypothetical protein